MVTTVAYGYAPSTPLRRSAILTVALAIVASLLLPVARASLLQKADPALLHESSARPDSTLGLIVRETNPSSAEAEEVLRRLGGTVTHELPIIGSFSGRLPARALPALAGSPAVARIWSDGRLHPRSDLLAQYDTQAADKVWMSTIEAEPLSSGAGVTVALLDTGVSEVPDLGDRVLARVDFTPDHDGYDRFGHGTHMAGIIAGDGSSSAGRWPGVAPRANLVSVKVAGADGSTDVSVVIAGLQWVVAHKSEYDISILNLSYGTDSTQSYLVDPLDYAVEQVWASGIFVVVAAGNRGGSGTVSKPGDDPFVMTVGAMDTKNTMSRGDDELAPFSSRGPTQDGISKPDLVAPGISIVSNRAVGSTLDELYPSARVRDTHFKGTGTSQSAAMVSGVAATLLQADPSLSPDMLKAILIRTAARKVTSTGPGAGAGTVNGYSALRALRMDVDRWIQPANRGLIPSTGLGSLDASRGSSHVYADVDGDGDLELVEGEIDVLGNEWSNRGWSGNEWAGNEWSAYVSELLGWSGNEWAGDSWSGTSWSGNEWAGNEWSGNEWAGDSWSANTWN
jgi:serine protease AprX